MNTVLQIDDLSISFGGLKAVQNVHLLLNSGDLQGLIGPNGAGKTTLFNLITGVYKPHSGLIRINGTPINGQKPHRIAYQGLARTFQNIRLFPNLTVLDNVKVACHLRTQHSLLGAVVRSIRQTADERAMHQFCMELLTLFQLDHRAQQQARNLPYGDQRRLEIARALATQPSVLLLDEPAAGMNPQEKIELQNLIRNLRTQFKLTILLIEHDMNLVMNLCEMITVLDYGKVIAAGTPHEIQNNPHVIQAYLGIE